MILAWIFYTKPFGGKRRPVACGLRQRNTTKNLNGAINEIYNIQKDFDEIISITGGKQ
jgi:hypothetical protein